MMMMMMWCESREERAPVVRGRLMGEVNAGLWCMFELVFWSVVEII